MRKRNRGDQLWKYLKLPKKSGFFEVHFVWQIGELEKECRLIEPNVQGIDFLSPIKKLKLKKQRKTIQTKNTNIKNKKIDRYLDN